MTSHFTILSKHPVRVIRCEKVQSPDKPFATKCAIVATIESGATGVMTLIGINLETKLKMRKNTINALFEELKLHEVATNQPECVELASLLDCWT